ncbi:pentatricopeptide repeat-containing protein DOT4, chloroplastic-like isoform X2 [Carica papaya]|uniref:pentatricopeptide repeat-containing protein DOT4, chloroplastic-like isoform X2 n=1 Tax=Carica papaya TaxID=3649 RepID=UPI000B8C9B3F|nr:pentatricopeptide repeat-containing protein DOT4, chloroplastic-like isoform X2 [Carica papaya]
MFFWKIKKNPFDYLQKSFFFSCKPDVPSVNPFKTSKLISSYFKLGKIREAQKLFDEMTDKNVVSWSVVIHGYAINGFHSKSVELFSQMRILGFAPNSYTVVGVLVCARGLPDLVLGKSVHGVTVKSGFESNSVVGTALLVLGDLRRGRQVHSQAVICGIEYDLPLANSLITMYAKRGELQSSKTIFNQMTQKSLVSWTAIISGCLQNGHPREAMKLFMEVWVSENYSLDSALIVSALTASGVVAAFELCQQLHCYSLKAGFSHYRSVQNSVISAYANSGCMDFAQSVFEEMGCLQDLVSWNAIINGYGMNSQGEAALALYHKMRKSRGDIDRFTYSCILGACSHSGLITDGLMIFNEMVEENEVMPCQEHYGCIVDLLARAGCLSEASGFVDDCFEVMGPNALRALLSGCVLHGNVELAEVVAKKLFEQDPEESGHVVLLSNVYASVGRFQNAETLRTRMDKQRLMKNPGISSLGESSYDFG